MIETRRAGPDDLPALRALYRDLMVDAPPVSLSAARERLQQIDAIPGSGVWIAIGEGRAVATASVIVLPNLPRGGAPFALIENVVTAGEVRGRGFGRAALDAATDAAWAAGCYKVMLLTDGGPEAEAFYAAAGFTGGKTGFQKRRIPPRPV